MATTKSGGFGEHRSTSRERIIGLFGVEGQELDDATPRGRTSSEIDDGSKSNNHAGRRVGPCVSASRR